MNARPVSIASLMGVFWAGVLSMGFQLLGTRILAPYFGSSIYVWAWLVITFLGAYGLGSLTGGWLSRGTQPPNRFFLPLLGCLTAGFVAVAVVARGWVDWLDARDWPLQAALGGSCLTLFFLPAFCLACLMPLIVRNMAEANHAAGFSSGLIYGLNTLGNIAGVVLTVFILIPSFPVSVLLWSWVAGALLLAWLLLGPSR
jgi:hypothetical protein